MPAFAVSVGDNFIIKKKRGDLKIPVNSGLIEIFLFSSCFNYILGGDLSVFNWMCFVFLPNTIELISSIEFDWLDSVR